MKNLKCKIPEYNSEYSSDIFSSLEKSLLRTNLNTLSRKVKCQCFWQYLESKKVVSLLAFVSSSLASISQRKNPNGAIEEITRKVVGTNVLSGYSIKMDRIDDIEWKNILKANRYSGLNW